MNWVFKTLTSSLGRKLLMSLTGLFLISFLVIHLIGNLQILKDDHGLAFNAYAVFMTSNPIIKTVSYLLYFSILLHAVVGLWLTLSNRVARGGTYRVVHASDNSSWASRNMFVLGLLIFAFLFLHLKDFWWKYKFGGSEIFVLDANGNRDLYTLVVDQFQYVFTVVAYLIGVVALGIHLAHGFASAFQTLGLEHKKYTPAIKFIGIAFSIVVPAGFALLPVYVYFMM
jgi:succinate dehydrogenase / fumarate reductase cytochrome b subunit